jgi:hypothetical protein
MLAAHTKLSLSTGPRRPMLWISDRRESPSCSTTLLLCTLYVKFCFSERHSFPPRPRVVGVCIVRVQWTSLVLSCYDRSHIRARMLVRTTKWMGYFERERSYTRCSRTSSWNARDRRRLRYVVEGSDERSYKHLG